MIVFFSCKSQIFLEENVYFGTNFLARNSFDDCRFDSVDGHAGRNLPRMARTMHRPQPEMRNDDVAKILLRFYVRILLQSLGDVFDFDFDRFSIID